LQKENIHKIKARINREIEAFIKETAEKHRLDKISPETYRHLRDFSLREGKRIRSILFVLSYLGNTKNAAPYLFRTAIAVELIHAFILIHDDIIDRSELRRGIPSLHTLINRRFAQKRKKFTGQDMAMVVGDILFSLGIQAFLAIKEEPSRKERALSKLLESALYTGCGEINELLHGLKNLRDITKEEIYAVYDHKTGNYTFITPLVIGAILAGASKTQINKLQQSGLYLGRAYQINDDLLGIFGNESTLGKPPLADVQEAKRTLLIWHAYNNSNPADKNSIKRIFSKSNAGQKDLEAMRQIIARTGAIEYALSEIHSFVDMACKNIEVSKLKKKQKDTLLFFINNYFRSSKPKKVS
jgi:geranylgeranyl diphosphate synthase type I